MAPKTAKKAKAPAAAERKPRKATTFTLAAKKPKDGDLGPQATLVYDRIKSHPGETARQVGESIQGKLETKQDPVRVAAFYIQQFVADGLVKKGKAA